MQETDKGKTSYNNLPRSPHGLERLAYMKNMKRNQDQGIHSDEDLSTHTELTLVSLRQSKLFTSLRQEAKGNMRSEPQSTRRKKRKKETNLLINQNENKFKVKNVTSPL
jgi:hypothetical protein